MNTDIKVAGKVASTVLDITSKILTPGINTKSVDLFAENHVASCYPQCRLACKNYNGFPGSICVSVNEDIIHGIPDDRLIKDGDVVKIDLVVEYKGWYADTAKTFIVGKDSKESKKLIAVAKKSLDKAIEIALPNNTIGDIGYTLQKYAEKAGFSVIREFCGHGVGQSIHQPPKIPCYGEQGKGDTLEKGMVLAIESMIFAGKPNIEKDKDGWTIRSKDKSLTAHFEHTIIVDEKPLILT